MLKPRESIAELWSLANPLASVERSWSGKPHEEGFGCGAAALPVSPIGCVKTH